MKARAAVRFVVAPVAGAMLLLAGSAIVVGLPAAHAVAPPGRSVTLASTAPVTRAVIAQVETDTTTPGDPAAVATDPSLLDRAELVRELEAAGLELSDDERQILSVETGVRTPRQLVLAQTAFDRFGIVRNPFFDPRRAAVVHEGEAVADLSTGVILGHPLGSGLFGSTEVIPAGLLEQLRAQAGWTITAAREAEAATYARIFGGYVPAFLQSDEAYALYKERARSNYSGLAAAA